jgi:putative transposase
MNEKKEINEGTPAQRAVIDSVNADYRKPADLIGDNGLLKQSTQSIFDAALKAEIA